MANKRINDFTETTNPESASELLVESVAGITLKSKLSNLLKRLFSFDDVYDDYLASGLNMTVAGGNSSPTFKSLQNGIYGFAFVNSPQIQEGFFSIHTLHDMKPNTNMTFHIHWTHNTSVPSGNMKWNIEYSLAKGYGQGTFSTTQTLSTIQTAGAQYTHHITNDDDMTIVSTGGEVEPDSILLCRIYRNSSDAQDTFNGDAFLLNMDIHYVRSRTGTTERNAPFTSGGF